jgi:primosomal protein N''
MVEPETRGEKAAYVHPETLEGLETEWAAKVRDRIRKSQSDPSTSELRALHKLITHHYFEASRALIAEDDAQASEVFIRLARISNAEKEAEDQLLQQANAVLASVGDRMVEVNRQLDRALAKLGA